MTSALVIGVLVMCVLAGCHSKGSDDADRSVQVKDIKMGYRTHGDGHPLVMIMGYGSTMNLWELGLIRSFSPFFKVIVFDNRGMGRSEAGSRPFTIEQFADDTAGLMDALGIPKAHILGWSMGALIAEEVALRHPGKVSKLVLYAAHCDANLYPPTPEVIRKMTDASGSPEEKGMRFISVLFPPDWLRSHGERIKEVFFRPLGNISTETIGKQSMAIGAWKGCCDRLDAIKAPTLIIAGADDLLVPPENTRYLAGKIPGAKSELLDGSGHGLMFQSPDRFSETVISFLRE